MKLSNEEAIEMKANFNKVNYWYDPKDMTYKTDKFGYESTIDISSIPKPALDKLKKKARGK